MSESHPGIFVYKTNIFRQKDVESISSIMNSDPRVNRWNVDREDIDNVLRIEADPACAAEIRTRLSAAGYWCEELPD